MASVWSPASGDRRALLVVGVPAYLLVVAFQVRDILDEHTAPVAAVSIAGVALFSALFLWVAVAPRGERSDRRLVPVVAMTVLALALMVGGPNTAVYLASAAAMAGDNLAPRRATPLIALATAGVTLGSVRAEVDFVNTLTTGVVVATVGLMTLGLRELARTNDRLVAAREEVARLAVVEERLRFARDLHDLLGHSLTVIRAKSELATRLVPTDVDRAANEMAEVERLAREALADVRETVTGHRRRRLATELDAARDALVAAGITPRIEADPPELRPDVDDALAFVLREGVTNVIRHSGASECRVDTACDEAAVRLSIADNGKGSDAVVGNGLVGARERLAAVGGTLEAGSGASGYELVASVPRAG